MNKDFNFMQDEKYSGDAVINRGYDIYDEWQAKQSSSREIVSFVELAVAEAKQNNKNSACIEALSYLFALDMRIKEKYNSFWKRLFSYFSWRREAAALKRLKKLFRISNNIDVRTAIEIELKKLREKIEREAVEDGDDDVHGGKRNGKAEEEAVEKDEKQQDEVAEENAEELSDDEKTEEASEQKTDEPAEQTPENEQAENAAEKPEAVQTAEEEPESVLIDEKELAEQIEGNEPEEENNGPDNEMEPSADKQQAESTTQKYANEIAHVHEQRQSDAKAAHYVNENVTSNIAKGNESNGQYESVNDAAKDIAVYQDQNTATNQRDENKLSNRDIYFYDSKMDSSHTEAEKPTEKISNAEAEQAKAEQTKAEQAKAQEKPQEQPKEQAQSNTDTQQIKDSFKELRVPIQVDITLEQENKMRGEISYNMPVEAILEQKRIQSDIVREQLDIALDEFINGGPVDTAKKVELVQVKQPSVAPSPNRK